jgi:hypothetical protein
LDAGDEEDLNYEEIEKLYQTEEIDKNVDETKRQQDTKTRNTKTG